MMSSRFVTYASAARHSRGLCGYSFLGGFGGDFACFADVFEDADDVYRAIFLDLTQISDGDKVETGLWQADILGTLVLILFTYRTYLFDLSVAFKHQLVLVLHIRELFLGNIHATL
jgi:hypothetical protein